MLVTQYLHELIKKMQDNSSPAETIKNWVTLYSDGMYSWAYHKTSRKEVAEDLVQESFLAAVQSIEKFEGKSNPKTWLFSILNNKINDYHRRNFKDLTINDSIGIDLYFDNDEHWKSEQLPHSWTDHSEHLLDNLEFKQTLESCMEKLPENWFSAVQLRYIEEKNGVLICQELDISLTNFWQMLHRAKLQLRKCLEINWFKG